MDSQTIREALGTLQVDPDSEQAWSMLRESALASPRDLSQADLLRLLDSARQRHIERGEWDAVAGLLDIEANIAAGSPREVELVREHARVLSDELFDDESAAVAYYRLLEISPEDSTAAQALEESEGKRGRYQDLIDSYLLEAEQAGDDVYASSMLMRAAEMELRFAETKNVESVVERLERAVRLDPSNERAGRMLERIYRQQDRWEELANVLERMADRGDSETARVGAGIRLARLFARKLDDNERAARAYDRVLRDAPEHPEAIEFLSEFYSNEDRWDDLVAFYERGLTQRDWTNPEKLGDMFQIAMLHWRKRERPADAEPWFERIRKLEPTHDGMLNFYREYYGALDDDARLLEVLQGAQRAARDGTKRAELSAELGKLAEGQANANKAIEQYKSVLRQNPDDEDAREALKRLYKQTQGYNALVELLRQQLERTDPEQYDKRLAILREVAGVYRDYIRSDTALVSVLNQIIQLDNKLDVHDVGEVRELVHLYEKLSRWRDLLTTQLLLADITDDVEEKKTLYRSVARRWLEQFSNVQQATEAFAALLKVAPDDHEARERLEELYRRRRAWPAMYELFESELPMASDARRMQLMQEMAQLAADRLNRGADAVRLYKQILELDPSRTEALDALERHAERAKDWVTLAEALERRVELLSDVNTKLAVLQKLGSVYADQIGDHQSAARAWRRVLELQPGQPRALRVLRDSYLSAGDFDSLEELYAAQHDWEGLADVLSNAADRAKEAPARIELSYRAAAVYSERLRQPDRAFRSYERILATDPADVRAAEALVPLYEKDEKWARLPALYELLYDKAEDENDKIGWLERLVEVSGKRLSDRKAAAAYARKAYDLSPSSETALNLLEETSRAAATWDSFVEALEARLTALSAPATEPRRRGKKRKKGAPDSEPAAIDAEVEAERRLLELKLARVYAEELGKVDQAVQVYKRLLEREPGDADAAQALEVILRRDDRRDDLRWLLGLKVKHAPSHLESVDILADWAVLEEDVFESPENAIDKYRRLLELDPTHRGTLLALPRLLLAAGDAEGAVAIIEQHRDQLSGDERAELEVQLARLYLSPLELPEDALQAAVRALDSQAHRAAAIEVLERLLERREVKLRAAEVLASEYSTSGDARREANALSVILDQTKDDAERMILYGRLADVYEQKLSAHSSAFDVLLRAVRRYPKELSFWDRAEQLAAQARRPGDLSEAFREVLAAELPVDIEVELCERAAGLHEDKLGDPIGATPYLEKVLSLDPSNEAAFARLKDILTAAERWGELEELYDRAASATDDTTRRTDMLVEVALICEEIIEDSTKATRYYERILQADPQHDAAAKALDRLYARQGRNKELATLLERRLHMASGEEVFEIRLRLAKIQLELLEPDKAIGHVEDVLNDRPNDYVARELAERMLEIGSLRVRAARMLETVYETRHEIRDLDRVLAIRLEGLDAELDDPAMVAERSALEEERRELLRRIATLRDDRLHNDEGALEALARLVPADPFDVEARGRLVEVGRRVGAHARVAEVLAQAADKADTAAMRGEILMQVARIYEDLLGDREKAEQTYRRVLELDETDPDLVLPAAGALERIYFGGGQHDKLAETLRVQVRLEQDTEKRRELFGRLGEICDTALGDYQGAIEAWRARLEENPGDETALAALDRLYEQTEQWRPLVEILERRREVSDDRDQVRTLMTRIASTLRGKLASVPEAIEAYQALVVEFGPDAESLRALEQLFHTAKRWDDLAETFEKHLEIAESDEERLDLLAKLGDLRRQHLNDVEGALEVYRRALSIDAAHPPSRAALEDMLEAEDPAARREAAAVLHPIYETEGANERLVKVIEIEVDSSEDPLERLDGLESAMRVAEGPLGDRARAFGYAQRAVRESLGHSEIRPWLQHLERLASATDRQREHVQLLCEIVPEIYDGDVQLAVTQRIAEISRHELADRELARDYYKKALELRPDDKRTLTALESLYDEAGDAQNLLDILERRVEVSETDEERKQLLFRRARLLAEGLEDQRRAIQMYEAIADLDLDPVAVEELEKLYRETEQWGRLIELYQRQLDRGFSQPADLHVKIAAVAAKNQNEVQRAFDELESALEINRQHQAAIAELERLLAQAPEAEHRARAASLLEPVYLLRADYDKVMSTIQARLEFASDPIERRDLLTRLAQLYEEQKEDYRAALETIAKLLPEDLSDETTTHELERLGKVAGAQQRLAEIYAAELEKTTIDDPATARLSRRTGELFVELGDLDRALGFYHRALAFEPDSRALFDAIDDILKRTQRHEERVKLYRDALEYRFDAPERLRLLHTIAELQRQKLSQPDDAIDTYRAALDVEEANAEALDALTDLYRERNRWEDLAELYLRRAELAGDPEQSARYRLALARLYREGLDDKGRAIEQLEEIVRSLPSQSEAIKELEALRDDPEHKERVVEILRPLYESTDDWRHLIKLNEDRFQLATETADKVSVLRETATLWESRGRDFERARRVLAEAFRLEPDDPEVRADYERLVEQGRAWDQLAELYEGVLEKNPNTLAKRDILLKLAQVHDVKRDDPRRALGAYDRLRAVDEGDLEPLNMMDDLSTLLSDWPTLVRVLTVKADLVLDDQQRAREWRRVGEVRRDMLDDERGASEAYEKALDLDPESTETVERLISLYETKQDAARLVELYQRRVELATDGEEELKYDLLLKAADRYEKQLDDNSRAIELLNQALDVRPDASEVRGRLNHLYRLEQMWPELLDNLRLEAGVVTEPARRAELRKQIGDILADKQQAYEDALDAYQAVLEEAPEQPETIAAVREIGKEHDDLRRRVADILVPVLRQTERWKELVEVLEMRLTIESAPEEKTETLRTIAQVLEERLDRKVDAQTALLRALSEQPEVQELHADIERLAEASDGWGRYADALSERAQSTFEPEVGKDLYTRLGRIAEDRLKDDKRAVEAYSRAVEQSGDQPDLLLALDRLYSRVNEPQQLSEILERRVTIEESQAEQASLYHRLALIQIRDFEDRGRGLSSLRMALERAPEHEAATEELEKLTDQRELFDEAAEILENVYRSRGRTDRLAALYEKRVGFAESPGERIDMRKNLARVLEDDCGDAASAQRVLQQGLLDDPADSSLLEELERLAPLTHNWEGAAAALREAIDNKPDLLPQTASELCMRLARWQADKIEDRSAAEQALKKALEFEPESDEVLQLIEQLQRAPGREADLVATLRRRAKLQIDEEKREDLYRQAKQLSDTAGDPKLAEEVLRELLAQDDTNLWALADLTSLREAAGDYAETFELLVRRSELRAQGDLVRELRRSAAAIARDRLDDKPKAIELYQQLFEDDPNDIEAAASLRSLYQATARWQDLGRLLERLVDLAESPAARSLVRIELSKLTDEHFEMPDRAIEVLREVLYDEPGNSDAVVALSELYEKTDRDEDLAELLSSQIEAARERGDTESELRFQVRLGEVYESRLKDRNRAIETYRSVLSRQAEHRGALEALTRLFQAGGQHAEAAEILEQLLSMSQGDEMVRLSKELATEYEKLKDEEKAARALERGLGEDSKNAELRSWLQKLYESMKAWDKLAELVAGNAEFTDSVDDKVRLLRDAAQIHAAKRKDHAASAELLASASALKPDDREILLELCDAYSASGRGKAAAEVLEKIVESYGGKRSKELGEIHRRLANAYLADGETQRALDELDKAFRIEPGNIGVLKQLGEVAMQAGDYKKAQQMFRALLLQKLDPASPITKGEVFVALADVHEKLGETPKAIQMLERAIQADDSLDIAKTRLAQLKGG